MLEVINATKKFGSNIAVNNISFTIKPGEILGLLGTNGAGKTTTFRMILGIFKPDSGDILLNGKHITMNDSPKIGFLPEERSLLQKYTINEQLLFFGELKGKSSKELAPEITKWLEYFNLADHQFSKIKELSKGNQQKIQFISSILHKPELLILDEPFSGLDPVNINLMTKVIKQLQAEGTMIIFSSHRLDHVESFSKDIIVLEKGNTILDGNLTSIKQQAHEYSITITTDDKLDFLSNLEFIKAIEQTIDGYTVKIGDYQDIDLLFTQIKAYQIRGFEVNLPSLEDLILKAVGGQDE